MFERRILITGSLKVSSPLHIGTGEFAPSDSIRNKENDPVQMALICRDHKDEPYIPGSTLKGMLRSLCTGREDGFAELFGEIKREKKKGEDETPGRMGRLIVYGAEQVEKGNCAKMPGCLAEDGTFIAARTSIDDATGTAKEGKLFYQQMVAPGARFSFRLRWLGDQKDAGFKLLLDLLATIAQEDGVALGKGKGDGQGRARLEDGTCFKLEGVDVTTPLTPAPVGAALPSNGKFCTLRLSCDGPFMVNDWDYQRQQLTNKNKVSNNPPPQLRAQRRGSDPLLPGTSLMGALRARAQWLYALDCLQEDEEQKKGHENPVHRLFGADADTVKPNGFAGILKLVSLELEGWVSDGKNEKKLTSVKLDRFSGAPIDNALFSADTFLDPVFVARLELDRRAQSCDEDFMQRLADDIKQNGLMLGAGSSKGFGWFKGEVV